MTWAGLPIAKRIASGASPRLNSWLIRRLSSAPLRSVTATASANSCSPQQLTPSRSSSFSVRMPTLIGASSFDIPTWTARPPEATMPTIATVAAAAPVASNATGGPAGPAHRRAAAITSSAPCHGCVCAPSSRASARRLSWRSITSVSAPRSRATRLMHCPIGPAPRTTARSPGWTAARFTARTAMETGSAIAATAGSPTVIGNTCRWPMARRS